MSFLNSLKERFPASSFETLKETERFNVIRFDVEFRGKKYWVVTTDGLYTYKMPVSDKYRGKEHVELCFAMEHNWDFSEEAYQWPIEKLVWLGNFMLDRETWFGAGHTIPNGNPPMPLSISVLQDHFFFDEATFMHELFKPFYVEETLVNFLFVLPITKDELAFKQKKSTYQFKRKLASKSVFEVIEEYRPSSVVKKWMFW